MLNPVPTAYSTISLSVLNPFAAKTMKANRSATRKRRTASFASVRWRGVPVVRPRKSPIESVTVRAQAEA